MNSREVFMIVDTDFSGDLWLLSRKAHVWIISSLSNDDAARAVWTRDADRDRSGAGVTTFQSRGGPVESLYALLSTIDDHHNEYNEWGPWDGIHVVGVELDSVSIDRMRDELALASVRIDVEPGGFVIRRAAAAENFNDA